MTPQAARRGGGPGTGGLRGTAAGGRRGASLQPPATAAAGVPAAAPRGARQPEKSERAFGLIPGSARRGRAGRCPGRGTGAGAGGAPAGPEPPAVGWASRHGPGLGGATRALQVAWESRRGVRGGGAARSARGVGLVAEFQLPERIPLRSRGGTGTAEINGVRSAAARAGASRPPGAGPGPGVVPQRAAAAAGTAGRSSLLCPVSATRNEFSFTGANTSVMLRGRRRP